MLVPRTAVSGPSGCVFPSGPAETLVFEGLERLSVWSGLSKTEPGELQARSRPPAGPRVRGRGLSAVWCRDSSWQRPTAPGWTARPRGAKATATRGPLRSAPCRWVTSWGATRPTSRIGRAVTYPSGPHGVIRVEGMTPTKAPAQGLHVTRTQRRSEAFSPVCGTSSGKRRWTFGVLMEGWSPIEDITVITRVSGASLLAGSAGGRGRGAVFGAEGSSASPRWPWPRDSVLGTVPHPPENESAATTVRPVAGLTLVPVPASWWRPHTRGPWCAVTHGSWDKGARAET